MKIKITEKTYDEVRAISPSPHIKPKSPNLFFRMLMKLAALPSLWGMRFSMDSEGLEKLSTGEPCLFLMNRSGALDFQIVTSLLFPHHFHIVTTSDSFVGRPWLMRQLGCISTKKFTPDLMMVRDIEYALNTLGESVVLFPEAGCSVDGTATAIPDTLGNLVKMLNVPVVMIRTYGAYTREPLYNNRQSRRVDVSAQMTCIYSKAEVEAAEASEIQTRINELFSFDSFVWQKERGVRVSELFRADGLNRVLYKCPHCNAEGRTVGKGTKLLCRACGKEYELTETGEIRATEGRTEFAHIPDWYRWERRTVRHEIESGKYRVDLPVEIYMEVDREALYHVGEGRLVHDAEGFRLTGCEGKLNYTQKPLYSYSVGVDFDFYELGDMICIGNTKALYYCFPKKKGDVVAKVRLASEELYRHALAEKARLEGLEK